MKRKSKRIKALSVAALAVLPIVWPLAAHYRARSQLEGYKRQLKAQGEKLSIAELAPNLPLANLTAGDALLAAAARAETFLLASNSPWPMQFTSPGRALVAWREDILPNYEVSNVWPALVVILGERADALVEVRRILRTHVLGFQMQYEQGLNMGLSHLSELSGLARWLSAATILDLHESRTFDAFQDLMALTALAQCDQTGEMRYCELARIKIAALAVRTAWEALQSSEWPDEDLKDLQRAWESVDFITQAESALAMERAIDEKMFVAVRESYGGINGGGFSRNTAGSAISELAQLGKEVMENPKEGLMNLTHRFPAYWHWRWWQSYEDELVNAHGVQAGLEAIRTIKSWHVFRGPILGLEQYCARSLQEHPRAGIWGCWAMEGNGVAREFITRIAQMEVERSLLISAIALKRFELKHGKYPAELAALIPEFLPEAPRDPMNGEPLRYIRNSDGSFLLYSVGMDGKDDHGVPPPIASSSRAWSLGLDAVWPQPATRDEGKLLVERMAAEWKQSVERNARSSASQPINQAEAEAFRKRYGLNPLPSPPVNDEKIQTTPSEPLQLH